MHTQGLSAALREQLCQTLGTSRTLQSWYDHLASTEITDARHVRIATEGALLGSLMDKGFNPELAIISDGAGQFAIGLHALCWIHAERLIHKLKSPSMTHSVRPWHGCEGKSGRFTRI